MGYPLRACSIEFMLLCLVVTILCGTFMIYAGSTSDTKSSSSNQKEDQIMGRFLLRFDIKEARGTQTYAVENARDAKHALELYNNGDSEFIDEEFEIMDLSENPDIIPDD